MILFENDRQDLPSHHNRSLYVTASIRGVELKCAMVDSGSTLNIIPLSILEADGMLGENYESAT